MAGLSKILCVIDPSQVEQAALSRASWLAQQTGAEVHLLICYFNEFLHDFKFFDSERLARARTDALDEQMTKLEQLAEPLREAGLAVSTAVTWANPLDEGILKQAIALDANIVLKDSRYHSEISRSVFTSTDWSLIRTCPAPLWLVKPGEIVDRPRIIAAIDPFHEHDKPANLDDMILEIGGTIASASDGELHAFHSFDPRIIAAAAMVNAYMPAPMSLTIVEQEIKEQHWERLTDIADRHSIGEDRCHLMAGSVSDALPALATRLDAAAVVMGAVSRGKLERFFVGATAEDTLPRLPCDLIVVKPSPFDY